MSIKTQQLEYRDGDTVLEAHVAWDEAVTGSRPGVLVSHTWAGRGEFEDRKAEQLAELGYVGFALDLYGKGIYGSGPEENASLMQPLLDDRAALQKRMGAALEKLGSLSIVDSDRLAAIGFCFGGLCVLDLMRVEAEIAGVASFHGLLSAPGNTEGNTAKAKVLMLHGWRDPMAPPEQVITFADEMQKLGADWELIAFGEALHAFTNPNAQDPDNGMQYDAQADRRSWAAMRLFLDEVLV